MEKFVPVVVIKEMSETDKILTALKKSGINCAEIRNKPRVLTTIVYILLAVFSIFACRDRLGDAVTQILGLVLGAAHQGDDAVAHQLLVAGLGDGEVEILLLEAVRNCSRVAASVSYS